MQSVQTTTIMVQSTPGLPTLSLVLPIFNEEAIIPELIRRLDSILVELPTPCENHFRERWEL